MPILRERVSWSKPRRPHAAELTADEQAGVRRALKALRIRYGGVVQLAKALGCSPDAVSYSAKRRAPTVALALLASRAAGVPISDILTGKYPRPGACPLCGHLTEGTVDHA